MVYVYQRTEEELNQILYNGGGIALTEQTRGASEKNSTYGGLTTRKSSRFGKENDIIRGSIELNSENVNN